MKIELGEARLLRDSISIINELVNEANFEFKKDRIEINALDPANVALTKFTLLSSACKSYDVKEERTLGVNLANLMQVLKRARPSDSLAIELDEIKNKLNIKVQGQESLKKFSLGLIQIDEEKKDLDLKFNTTVNINSILLAEIIEDAAIVADNLNLTLKAGKFKVIAEGITSSATMEINAAKTNGPDTEAKYSIEYLKRMAKASKLSQEATLSFSDDYPLKMEYILKDKLSLSFILAPRHKTE